jgi:hypothetical protein
MNASGGCKKVKMHINALLNYLGACKGIFFGNLLRWRRRVNNQVEKGVRNLVRKLMKNGAEEVEKPIGKWVK